MSSHNKSKAALDTTPRREEKIFQIQRWNAATETWDKTTDRVSVTLEWRILSSREVETGVTVSGGYTITWMNPTTEKVDIHVEKLLFQDVGGIPVTELAMA